MDEINKEIKDNEDKEFNFYKLANLNLFRNKIFNDKTSIENELEEQAKMEKNMIHQRVIK